ncbi:MAG: hypothetical protein AW07_01256 [Candidatus Accumulibacter sp. SK-11]|nr:MAG: hypothetical protein AW07_01256 [Candidatus Accumulibacter sp. SK-11]
MHHLDGGDLRHADAGDDARGADRPGADADLDAVCAVVEHGARGISGGDVAADHLDGGEVPLDPADTVEDALRMAVCGVDDEDVDACLGEQFGPFLGARTDADGGADAQAAGRILAGVRMLGGLDDVLDGDQAAQLEGVVDHQDALQAVLVDQRLALFDGRSLMHRHQPRARGHDVAHRLVEQRLEAQVAVGDDADDDLAIDDRHAGDPVQAGQGENVAYRHRRRDGDRILQDARFEALDAGDFGGLCLWLEVLVHDADAAFLGQGNRQTTFGDRVHRRRNQRQVEADVARQARSQCDIAWHDRRVGGQEKHVVERQRPLDYTHGL